MGLTFKNFERQSILVQNYRDYGNVIQADYTNSIVDGTDYEIDKTDLTFVIHYNEEDSTLDFMLSTIVDESQLYYNYRTLPEIIKIDDNDEKISLLRLVYSQEEYFIKLVEELGHIDEKIAYMDSEVSILRDVVYHKLKKRGPNKGREFSRAYLSDPRRHSDGRIFGDYGKLHNPLNLKTKYHKYINKRNETFLLPVSKTYKRQTINIIVKVVFQGCNGSNITHFEQIPDSRETTVEYIQCIKTGEHTKEIGKPKSIKINNLDIRCDRFLYICERLIYDYHIADEMFEAEMKRIDGEK
jgi:hypothetical protein